MASEMPPALDALVSSLVAEGFTKTRDEDSGSFGDRLVEFRRDENGVRLVRDRGDWQADLMFMSDWWDPELIVAASENRDAQFVHDPAAQADRLRAALALLGANPDAPRSLGEKAQLVRERRGKATERAIFGE